MIRHRVSTRALRLVLLVASVVLVSACGARAIAPTERAAVIQGRVVAVYMNEFSPMLLTPGQAMTAGLLGALGGVVAAGTSIQNGRGMVAQFGLPNPAALMRDRFVSAFREAHPGVLVESFDGGIGDVSASALAARFPDTSVFVFAPGITNIMYLPTRWNRYRMQYLGGGELMDTKTGQVLWRANCNVMREDGDNAPTLDDLYAGNGARLKAWIANSAEECAGTLIAHYAGKGQDAIHPRTEM